MNYKKLMGYSTKKRVIKEKESKPKKNRVLEDIKQDLNEWNDKTFKSIPKRWTTKKGLTEFETKQLKEVGASYQHQDALKNIFKAEENMHKYIQEYTNFLKDQGLEKEAKEFSSNYVVMIGKFTHWLKTKWTKALRKMI